MTRIGVDPPGADDPTLDPPPADEDEESVRRERIRLADIADWYREHGLPLDVDLRDWRPDVEGRFSDAEPS